MSLWNQLAIDQLLVTSSLPSGLWIPSRLILFAIWFLASSCWFGGWSRQKHCCLGLVSRQMSSWWCWGMEEAAGKPAATGSLTHLSPQLQLNTVLHCEVFGGAHQPPLSSITPNSILVASVTPMEFPGLSCWVAFVKYFQKHPTFLLHWSVETGKELSEF